MTDQSFSVEQLDTSRPHPARMYDYFLGGRDNYQVDREAAQRVLGELPDILPTARENRAFLHRAVRHVVRSGVRQILDIGTGIPTSPNTHEVALAEDPTVRVAYVDNDPIVAVHAGARLTGAPGTGFALGDVRDPAALLELPAIRDRIDLGRPVAVLLVAVLHFVTDEEDPYAIVATLRDALPAGSHLVLSHATADFHPGDHTETMQAYRSSTATMNPRTHAEVVRLFDGFDLLEPGVVQLPRWRPDGDPPTPGELRRIGFYGGVARKD
ncbi:SAM-dependent methyltransferase [Streptomyces pactum]|uniref:SAM-dependent methyltransferase n=1 Tax=Streptomyces pactum TaxID=68249 RepID=A0ABS0NS01_9ACTN|nr:SAM-dependent methyltransferase [Streptomyces pactum]MBH5337847.1 SAM-dependent methyltransferase [Streptomyces pactum]